MRRGGAIASKLELKGLDEFRRALRNLPEDLAREAGSVVLAHAEEAQHQIVGGYPEGPTGNLKARVQIERNTSTFGTRAIVRSRAPHANLFERGTRNRTTRRGFNRGRMPEAPIEQRMIPKVIRARRRMVEALKDVVRRAGFEVRDTV